MKKRKQRQAILGFLCVLPVLVIILTVKAYPMAQTIIKSFTNWDGLSKASFRGIANYIYILKSDEFRIAIVNNLIFLLHIPVKVLIAMIFALMIYDRIPGYKLFRSVSYIPQVISATIIGYLFCILFGYDGPINVILRNTGLEQFAIDWLGKRWSAVFVISIVLTWHGIGYVALLILGGLTSIPEEIFEAAKLDGASYSQRLFYVTIPLLGRTLEYVQIINISWVFTGLFSFIFSMTKGGPGYDTATLDYLVYNKAFVTSTQMGLASSLAVILVVIVGVITIFQLVVSDRREDY